MFGFGKKGTFEIDGIRFTVVSSFRSFANNKSEIRHNGELVQAIEKLPVAKTEFTINGKEYKVIMTFGEKSKLSTVSVFDEDNNVISSWPSQG